MKGKIEIRGLGGSYGMEKLILYKMKKKMGKPTIITKTFPKNDNSWNLEVKNFFDTIDKKTKVVSDLNNAIENMKIINRSYKNYYDNN